MYNWEGCSYRAVAVPYKNEPPLTLKKINKLF